MAFSLPDVFASWEGMGVFDIALPFLLVFTLIFAILERSKILGAEGRRFNIIIAAILGLLVVRNPNIVELIHRLLPNVALIVVIIIMILLLIGIFLGSSYSGLTGGLMGFVVLVSIGLVLWSLGSDQLGLTIPDWLENLFADPEAPYALLAIVLGVIAIALVFGGIGRGKSLWQSIGDGLKKLGSGFGGR